MLDSKSTLDEVRAKYVAERDKRIRRDGNDQFTAIAGDLEDLGADPYGGESTRAEPITDWTEVLIIGGGFGGLTVAGRLKAAGVEDLRIVEKGSDVGGTWYWNRYPGVQCDIESYIYLPLLEETGYMPSLKYSYGDEIRQHCERIADHFDLYDQAVFSTEVTEVAWDPTAKEWTVHTDHGDAMRARHVVMANGPLNRPKLPGIPGITTFGGHMFHTSRWDYDYTGGDQHGELDRLGDKKVAVIGTGATALQCVPHVARGAEHLYVVQRTPSAVDARNNEPTDPEWAAALEPGWQRHRADNFLALWSMRNEPEDLVDDLWCDLTRRLRSGVAAKIASGEATVDDLPELVELADFESMQSIRDRVERSVEDPETAELLKPYYRKLCKRPAFHDDYLPTFNRANVTLVDTGGQGVERIDETGFVVDGTHYEVDCIIFATGFEVGTTYTRRAGYDIIGADGVQLSEKWADGPSTFFGIQAADFPNLFFTSTIQGSTGINLTQTLDEQAQHIAHTLGRGHELDAEVIEVTAESEAAWVERVRLSGVENRRDFLGSCTPGYYNGEGGEGGAKGFWEHEFAGTALDFFEILRDWRTTAHLPGLLVDGKALEPTPEDDQRHRSLESVHVRLTPEMRRIVEARASQPRPPLPELGVDVARQGFAAAAKAGQSGPSVEQVRDIEIESAEGSIPARLYLNGASASEVIVYFHGGGWTVGSIDDYDAPLRRLASTTGAAVLSVGYRLAPEHPFPAAVDDAWTALRWATDHRDELRSERASLYVAGDSAGANLAAVMALRARDHDIELAGQILLYPSVSGDSEAPYFDDFSSPFLTKAEIQWFYDLYVPRSDDRTNVAFAPLLANSHADLAPALIVTAEFDLFRQEGALYRDALQAAGVPVVHRDYLGAMHGWFSVADGTQLAMKVHRDIAEFVASNTDAPAGTIDR
ncbi:flavin-containing monooxygenase [Ilumatobacter nonamiensis]|uniref:flavin-containing monooxygenase n=1 Tax=Ilumatobacter nonamiensis TaxID=467093 RepID=UPI0003496AC0|nr:alpha/beta hydrolase fold domain-containing protein [Ilumatobacter nonamiensis]